jgi:orotate phosphoribosyltransferase
MEIVRAAGASIEAVAVLVDRSTKLTDLSVPLISLLQMQVEAFPPDRLPTDLAAIPVVKPGSQ